MTAPATIKQNSIHQTRYQPPPSTPQQKSIAKEKEVKKDAKKQNKERKEHENITISITYSVRIKNNAKGIAKIDNRKSHSAKFA